MKEDSDIPTEKEVELLFRYFKRVKKIYLAAIIIIILLFAIFLIQYGLDFIKNPLILSLFVILIISLYLISMIFLISFQKKIRKLKDKL